MEKIMLFVAMSLCMLFQAGASEINQDEIPDLPGLEYEINFRQYSGYLEGTDGKFFHYWFVESQSNPSKDPLILWLNGGPGCSSLSGLLRELGPFQVQPDGKTLKENPFSWNKIANIIFLESPAGVGFSYSNTQDYSVDDNEVSYDNYLALEDFFIKYPQFEKNDLYIMGESYAGIYIPTLADRILHNPEINLKGIAIGNGALDKNKISNSALFFSRYHGLIGKKVWDSLITQCCEGNENMNSCDFLKKTVSQDCMKTVKNAIISVVTSGINIYNINADCPTLTTTNSSQLYYSPEPAYLDLKSILRSFDFLYKLIPTPPCSDSRKETTWLNQESVRTALHIPPTLPPWVSCNANVSTTYKRVYTTMKRQFLKLLSAEKLRILIYNGDIDLVCNFLGNEWFIDDLGLKVIKDYQPWKYNNQTAGFVKYYKDLVFLTVKGSGHMVPADTPAQAFKMISSFLSKKPY